MSTNKRRYCSGCRNDFYNGNNSYGIPECWSLKTATVVMRRFVHINQVPPWNNRPEWTLDCHRRPQFVSVDPKVHA